MTGMRPKSALLKRGRNRRLGARPTAATHAAPRAMLGALKLGLTYLAALTALSAAGVGIWAAWQALARSDRLRVHAIEYVGNERAERRELEAYTGVALGDAILDLDLDEVALQLRRHPWLAQARVRRQLPDRVVVEVREHTPAILVALGEVYIASDEGVLFKRLATADGLELPVLTGLAREDAQKRPDELRTRILGAIELARAYEAAGGGAGRLDELHFDADLGWSVVVSPAGDGQLAVRLHLGREPATRLAAATAAYARLRQLGLWPAELWADGQKHLDRVHARMRDGTPPQKATLIAKAK